MASNLLVPFDNRPASVAVKTASYTIPAGKYARVVVEVDSGGIFTIDGANAVTSSPFVTIDSVSGINSTITYTVPSGYRAIVTGTEGTSAGSFQINGNYSNPLGANGTTSPYEIGPSGTMTINSIGGTAYVQGVATPSNATHRQADLWLPTGTVISGSGNWRAVVMEYNEIT